MLILFLFIFFAQSAFSACADAQDFELAAIIDCIQRMAVDSEPRSPERRRPDTPRSRLNARRRIPRDVIFVFTGISFADEPNEPFHTPPPKRIKTNKH